MRYKTTLFLLLVLFFSFVVTNAQTKRALVIGLGEQEDSSWGKINGDKDVPIVRKMLIDAGYMNNNITTLINRQATKANIVSAFKDLAESCNAGDIVYVHFSGHGQQMKDIDHDESDDMDECWIPYDAYRQSSATYNGACHLTDDEINMLLMSIRENVGDTGKMLVVIDACHSGDGTRGDDGEVIRGVADIFETITDKVNSYKTVSFEVNNESTNPEQWITISACKSKQVNAELINPAVGKLSYGLCKIISEGKATDNKAIEKAIYMFVNNNSQRAQTPVVSGLKEKYNIIDILR